ncbi:MAG: PAS domain-containing protein [Pyrinomonadaceae bacterium]|nr:PAS domain-containing protein [Pyrinomonadaceae bacterium]
MNTDKSKIEYHGPQRIDSLPEGDFNALPFGAIKLDADGRILKYNLYESKLAGRDPQEVIGQNFFTEVAPCTNVQEFAGRYRQGIAGGELNTTFPYRFLFPKRAVDVEITLILSPDGQSAWVFVKESDKPIV